MMNVDLKERMRRFTVVVKYAKQTGQVLHNGFAHRGHRTLKSIALRDYQLSDAEYATCYSRAITFLHNVEIGENRGKTSDDMLAELDGPSPKFLNVLNRNYQQMKVAA